MNLLCTELAGKRYYSEQHNCAFTLGRKCEGHIMHRWWAFTPPVWCEFGGFSRYNFYSVGFTKGFDFDDT